MADKRRLIFSIVQFLNKELASDDMSEDAKESLEVANQCLQTAYCLAPEDTHLQVSHSLEDLFNTATQNEPVIICIST
jgi:small glutamine-rich tetratricopeptide repeat-containing protein alpha